MSIVCIGNTHLQTIVQSVFDRGDFEKDLFQRFVGGAGAFDEDGGLCLSGELAFCLDELRPEDEVLVEKPSDVILEILYASCLCRVDAIVSLPWLPYRMMSRF
jgi:hypothetical protein